MKPVRALLVLLLSVVSLNIFSQKKDINFEHLQTDDGLSQNTINCILKDSHGMMWFGTEDGLNKYDGYRFTVYRHKINNPKSIAGNNVYSLLEDKEGNLWVAAVNGGLSRYDANNDAFINYIPLKGDPNSLSSKKAYSLYEDRSGNIWIGTLWGLNLLNKKTGKFTRYLTDQANPSSISSNEILDICEDKKGNFWVGTRNGLDLMDRHTGKFTIYQHDSANKKSISDNAVDWITEDSFGNLWIGTDKGLELFDRDKQTFTYYGSGYSNSHVKEKGGPMYAITQDSNFLWTGAKSLSLFDIRNKTYVDYATQASEGKNVKDLEIYSTLLDDQNILWIGTRANGLYKYEENLFRFASYKLPHKNNGYNIITSFAEDHKGNIWIGTDAGISYFDRLNNSFSYFDNYKYKNTFQGISNVTVLQNREDNNIWVGSVKGLTLFDPVTGSCRNFTAGSAPTDLSDKNIQALFEDSKGNTWIGTANGGVNVWNKNQFIKYLRNPGDPNSLSSNDVKCFCEDKWGNIWIGTQNGIDVLNLATNKFTHYNTGNSNLNSDGITVLFNDSKNNIWAGSMDGGFSRFNKQTNNFKVYNEEQGLINNVINSLVEDDKGYLWISTANVIVRFDPAKEKFRNYNAYNGLQSEEFDIGAGLKTKNGEIFFGGINGFNVFNPSTLLENKNIPPVIFTGFELFNKPVTVGTKGSVLQQNISQTKEITLSHDQSVFTFEFAALNYVATNKNGYAYKLEGFDKDWNYVGTQRKATYTNLNPGEYTFTVKASNNDGIWNEQGTSIKIIIVPSYWQTWWFRLLIAAIIAGIAVYFYRVKTSALKIKKAELERLVKERTEKLEKMTTGERAAREESDKAKTEAEKARKLAEDASRAKSVFLATMSHEIRTPMNGVLGMTSLLAQTKLSAKQKEYTEIIHVCGETLLNVINDILDFSKIESGNMSLENMDFDLRSCIEEVLDVFAEKAFRAELDLVYQIDHNVPEFINGDRFRLRQILMNLLSNAIKFTNAGEIFVGIHVLQQQADGNIELSLEVRDTGIGIPPDKLDRLFQSFSQVDSSTTRKYGGTGLGLVICEKLAGLMGGMMQVKSEPGKGSTFSFSIKTKASVQPVRTYVSNNMTELEGKRILIVDDNSTNRTILHTQMELWKLVPVLASSGDEAIWLAANSPAFDLVISDMSMPGMDGVELAQYLRAKYPTLPIILLSSLGDTSFNKSSELFVSVITKPIRQQTLSVHILNALRKQGKNITHLQQELIDKKHTETFAQKHPLNILLAEDDIYNQMVAVQVFENMGYKIEVANNGRIAVEYAKNNYYDLILMDVQMPEMDGFEATKNIRQNMAAQPIIVAMTANAMDGDRAICLKAGMDDYISKPINLDELEAKLEKWSGHILNRA